MQRKYVRSVLALLLAACLAVPTVSLAKGGGGFGSGRSFAGGARSAGFSRSRSFGSPRAPSAPSRGTFRPSGGFATGYDREAASAQRMHSSRTLYRQANGIFNGGRTGAAEHVGPVNDETIATRRTREASIFRRYTTQPVPVIYHDSFSPWFWLWLMDRGQHDRDLWIYNHRDEMDDTRYRDLTQKDADLERRLRDLEQQGVPRDSSYAPAGVDRDLMYNDAAVQQAYSENNSHPYFGFLGVTLVGAGVAYLIFFVPMFRPRRRAW